MEGDIDGFSEGNTVGIQLLDGISDGIQLGAELGNKVGKRDGIWEATPLGKTVGVSLG